MIVLGCGIVLSHASSDFDKDLDKKLSDFFTKYDKIKPGMTRAALHQ